MDFVFWIKFIEIPVVAGMFWFMWSHHKECAASRRAVQEQITNIRLEIAKDYVNHASLKEIGDRLDKQFGHLAKQIEDNRASWRGEFETLRNSLEGWMHRCRPVQQKE